MKKNQQKFITAIAIYLTTSLAEKSIKLQMGNADAKAWADAYQAAGCKGYATQQEAEEAITELFQP